MQTDISYPGCSRLSGLFDDLYSDACICIPFFFFLVLFKIYVIILIFRSSEDIFAVLPSLPEVSRAVTITHSWMDRSKPYIARSSKVCGDVLEFSELKVRAISMGNFPLFLIYSQLKDY